ncbi:hypothetical protein AMK26_15660 [Streptomyces sp. CB03234]|uniref:MFS transporter n=1 Tax=Streptomyces sp. (strain CB03234) TaxID=1703937 RepID=UPI000938E95A|nr:MFS transporter [Streptomyces sp. CB03234]OKK04738.1 hypothetical protein AMK26_15660 [Streptomyces sp. CB03234]
MTDTRTAELLRAAAFRRLWTGDLVARLGHQIAQFMLPLTALTALQAGASDVGLVSASQTVPVIALSLVAGVAADRVPTRTLVVACNALRATGFGLLGLVYALSGLELWLLIATAVLIGSATVFYDVGYQATVPRVLTVEQLAAGNGFLQAGVSATQMAGPALAGFLVQSAGLPTALAVTALLFVAAVVSFWTLDAQDRGRDLTKARALPLAEGLKFSWRCRPIRDLCVQSGLFNLHEQAFLTVFLIYGVRSAGMSGGEVGLVIGAAAVGALTGALVTGHRSERLHAGRSVLVGLFAAALALLVPTLFAAQSRLVVVAVFLAGFFLNGFAQSLYNVFVVSLRQAIPPQEYLGAVTASYRLVSFGPMPLGALLGGALADLLGAGGALRVVALSMLVCSLFILPSPVKRFRTVRDARTGQRTEPQPPAPGRSEREAAS